MATKYIGSILLFCLLALGVQAQTRTKKVVERPGFVTANTSDIEYITGIPKGSHSL